ncbi:4-amino-4-deoxy-L-arabinose transferase-like glycosyltransferase [Endobacter medicaginis]|uniref:4-amino-4-deoxy-L-arabinose transferase-like glycosyltransferase n=2 Tax=Endobacter medicaginis TaxID=1181271 RepID=A0A839UXS8_9PROT|nr:glycosyltransferase family 39 protein [Endobacter medicaginis]MBB3172222.1 4-amino-4-deoxy-L-arabinose transferase-like glycosyltransferase [Endobacter medicaginis]MCX5474658.1 glycosyltransferase family 39 protein [Endobacter medicaginis]
MLIGAVCALVALTALRLLVAALTPLSPDEAYYWVWSHHLQTGYLDHPAMVALWIQLTTTLAGSSALGIRLSAPLSAAAGSIALAIAGRDLATSLGVERPARAGLWAALGLNATLALGAGSVLITPDTPLLFFCTLALAACGRVLVTDDPRWWLAIGLCLGLGLDSKYTTLLTALGLAVWLLATAPGRRWLRTPWPFAGAAVALAAFAPTLLWNARHGWASFHKQGGRTGAWHPTLRYLGELVGGQIGLATPLIALVWVLGCMWLWRRRRPAGAAAAATMPPHAAAATILLCVIALPTAVFVQHAIGDRVQANWPVLVYPALAIAGGLWCVTRPARWSWLPAVSLACAVPIVAAVWLQATIAPFRLPPKQDVTLARLAGWPALASEIDRLAPEGLPIAADEYGLASELAWHLPQRIVLGAEARWALFDLPEVDRQEVVLVRRLRANDPPDPALWGQAVPIAGVERCRNAETCADRYVLYRAIPADPPLPLAVLPSR